MQHRLTHALTRLSASPFRVLAYILHATYLERVYKPRLQRQRALEDFTDEVIAKLPRHSLSVTGARMDPMNLIFIAEESQLKLAFRAAGWHRASPASPIHLVYGLLTAATGRSYPTGPFTPLFVSIGLQDFAFQQPTTQNSFRERHHIRIWRTGIVLPGNKRIWVGAASFDVQLKVQFRPPFIHHAIDPDIDGERDFIVHSLEEAGAYHLKNVTFSEPVPVANPRANAYGARYNTDGQAAVVLV